MADNKAQVRVASIEVELGMSVQNKAGIWCKPTARMVLTVDGGTSPAQRAAIIKQGFDEVCENIEKLLEEMQDERDKLYRTFLRGSRSHL